MPQHSERGVTEPDVCPLLECDSILPALQGVGCGSLLRLAAQMA